MLNLMLVDMDLQTWFVISWEHSCRPIKIPVRISVSTNMDFDMDFLCNPRHGLEIVNMTKKEKWRWNIITAIYQQLRYLLKVCFICANCHLTYCIYMQLVWLLHLRFIRLTCKLIHKDIRTLFTIPYTLQLQLCTFENWFFGGFKSLSVTFCNNNIDNHLCWNLKIAYLHQFSRSALPKILPTYHVGIDIRGPFYW